MAWTTITPYTSGAVPTAAQFDQISENFRGLRYFKDAAVKVFLDANVSIPDGTDTVISWTDQVWQVGSLWSAGTNPSRITAPITGYYLFVLNVEWHVLGDSGERGSTLRKSSGTVFGASTQGSLNVATAPVNMDGGGGNSSALMIQLSAGQYVEARVKQTGSTPRYIRGGSEQLTSLFAGLMGV